MSELPTISRTQVVNISPTLMLDSPQGREGHVVLKPPAWGQAGHSASPRSDFWFGSVSGGDCLQQTQCGSARPARSEIPPEPRQVLRSVMPEVTLQKVSGPVALLGVEPHLDLDGC